MALDVFLRPAYISTPLCVFKHTYYTHIPKHSYLLVLLLLLVDAFRTALQHFWVLCTSLSISEHTRVRYLWQGALQMIALTCAVNLCAAACQLRGTRPMLAGWDGHERDVRGMV